jgi:hypothetical protein
LAATFKAVVSANAPGKGRVKVFGGAAAVVKAIVGQEADGLAVGSQRILR